MGEVDRTAASLRFFGDDLDPDEITQLLGARPTVGVRKGGVWNNSGGREITARRGSWRLEVERRQPGDLDAQIADLLSLLSADLSVWQELTQRYQADIFCGLFLSEGNQGIEVRPETLAAVGLRGLTLGLDIYSSDMV